MIDILGIKYISEKEASKRYGYSIAWFKKQRLLKLAPYFVKLQGKGRVLYPLDKTDSWFKEQLKSEY